AHAHDAWRRRTRGAVGAAVYNRSPSGTAPTRRGVGRSGAPRRPVSMSTPPPAKDKRALLREAALEYHEHPTPANTAIAATKQPINQHDLPLAYSPAAAAPCEGIVKDPTATFRYTAPGNLVEAITNGTAVLGLGDIGPLAAKPVMEGKGVLFKK